MPLNKPKHGVSLCISQQFHPKSLFPGFVAGGDLNKRLALASGVCLLLSWLGEQAGNKGLHKALLTCRARSREGLNLGMCSCLGSRARLLLRCLIRCMFYRAEALNGVEWI